MIAVFAAFMLGRFVPMNMVGLALAVSVLLDATVIRLVVGPALLQLAGRFNRWPGEGGDGSPRPRPPLPSEGESAAARQRLACSTASSTVVPSLSGVVSAKATLIAGGLVVQMTLWVGTTVLLGAVCGSLTAAMVPKRQATRAVAS